MPVSRGGAGGEGDTECEWGRGRDWDTESEAGSRLRAVSREPDAGLKLTNLEITTRVEVGCSTD